MDQAMKAVNQERACVSALNFSPEDVARGRAIAELKRKFEGVARAWESMSADDRQRCTDDGLSPQKLKDSDQIVYAFQPDRFVFACLGLSHILHSACREEGESVVTVDPWLVSGGLRKPAWFDVSRATLEERIPYLDADTMRHGRDSGSSTSWLAPLPVLWAKEGKNRIHTYQNENIPLLTTAARCNFLPAKLLRLYRSVWDETVWCLRYVGGDANWDDRVTRRLHNPLRRVVLPFPEAGVPLLLAYGVQVDRGWGVPWRLNASARSRASAQVRSTGWS